MMNGKCVHGGLFLIFWNLLLEDSTAAMPTISETMRQNGMDRAECSVDIKVQHLVPDVWVGLQHIAADIGARIGVEGIEPPGLVEDLRQHVGYAALVQKIGAAQAANALCGLGGIFWLASWHLKAKP